MTDIVTAEKIESSIPILGRNIVHDRRSRNFAATATIDKTLWRDKAVRIYDPTPNPNQSIGNCTGCAKAMEFNTVGNRVMGKVLKMADADLIYSEATRIDPFEGSYPPDDTGSSGLAAAKAAQTHYGAGTYRWIFGGADEIVANIMEGRVVNTGTYWHYGMFSATGGVYANRPVVEPTGGKAGGHQWIARGYDKAHDLVLGRCWWGGFKDFWISRAHLDSLMADYGDAHVQEVAGT